MRRGASFGVVWAVVALAAWAPQPLQAQSVRQEVTSLRFQGNQEYSGEALSRAILTRETKCRSILFQIVPFCLAGADFSLNGAQR